VTPHHVAPAPGGFIVTSSKSGLKYVVVPTGGETARCNCPAGRHGRACTHVEAVRVWARAEFDHIRAEMSACPCVVPVCCPDCIAWEERLKAMEAQRVTAEEVFARIEAGAR
jgi:hypothetical protein